MPTLGRGSSKMISRSHPPSKDLCSQTKYHSGNHWRTHCFRTGCFIKGFQVTLEGFSTFCLTIHCIPREDRLPVANVKSNVWGYCRREKPRVRGQWALMFAPGVGVLTSTSVSPCPSQCPSVSLKGHCLPRTPAAFPGYPSHLHV